MGLDNLIKKSYSCNDDNQKIIKRVYDWYDRLVQFRLCEKCILDSDFDEFVSETKIKEEVSQNSKGEFKEQ